MTPAAIDRQAARNRFLDEREYGMMKARAAPMVVLRPAAVTRPKARPTLPDGLDAMHSDMVAVDV